MTNENFDWRLQQMPWIVLGLLFVAYGCFVTTTANVNFPASIAYATSALIIAEMIYLAERGRDIGMFVGAILGCLPVMMGLGLHPVAGMIAGLIGIIIVWVLHGKDIKIGSERGEASSLILVPLVVWTIGAMMSIQNLMATMTAVPLELLVYPVGVALFTIWSVIRFFGIPKEEERAAQISYVLMFIAFIGMLLAG